jgi:hypothetical protein
MAMTRAAPDAKERPPICMGLYRESLNYSDETLLGEDAKVTLG